MNTNNKEILKTILQQVIPGTILLAKYLEKLGASRDLQQYYKRSGWLYSLAPGVFFMPQAKPTWQGAIYALQNQAGLQIHPGGLTALSLQGFAHYIRQDNELIYIFSQINKKLPKWFVNRDLQQNLQACYTNFLPDYLGIIEFKFSNFSIKIASAERAILECLFLAPEKMDIVECYHLMEGLVNLRPDVLQTLLENCKSIKVKRLFLFMANKAKHSWLKYLDLTKIDIGKGDRLLAKNGVYDKNYQITIPKELRDL